MNIEDLKLILKVAEFRSITLAAAKLDMRTAYSHSKRGY